MVIERDPLGGYRRRSRIAAQPDGSLSMIGGAADKGAHFYRCDFQVHTPRDSMWNGAKATTDDERNAYATRFVAECRRIGLGAVAITDHHDMLFAPIIRAAAAAERDRTGNIYPKRDQLIVFPGIELTLGLSRQALLILDSDFPQDRMPGVLEALAITPHAPAESTLPDVVTLDHITSLTDLHNKLNERDWLRGHFIILPNVTDSGHKTIMRKGMQAEYKAMPCVGGYVDGSFEKTGSGNLQIFSGLNDAWGNKPLAVLQTSDSRRSDFTTLGQPSTWVKWAAPTAEALRQACLGRQSRITHSEPVMPSVYISGIEVTNSTFLGPFQISLNPQYNAMIGGRGTGKSTILDYMRWALCDQTTDVPSDELADPRARRQRLIESTLKSVNGKVDVSFTINAITHVVRRSAATGELLIKVGSEEFAPIREADVRALLPIHAYSQKQLSSVALREDELTRFVTASVQRQLDDFDSEATELAGRLRENYATLQRARNLDVAIERSQLSEKSLAEQAANLRASLSDISDEDRAILDVKPAVDQTSEVLAGEVRDLDGLESTGRDFLARADRVLEDLRTTLSIPPSMEGAVKALRVERVRLVEQLNAAVAAALTQMLEARSERSAEGTAASTVELLIQAFDQRYEDVKRRSTANDAKLLELAQVEERRRSAAMQASRLQGERRELGDPSMLHDELRSQLVEVYGRRSQLLADACEELTILSEGLLRASLSRGQGLDAIGRRFRSMIQGSGVRATRIETLFSNLREETEPLATWELVLKELEALLLGGVDGQHTSELTPTLTRLEFPIADQQRIRGYMTTDGWLDLALIAVQDQPVFRYQTKENEFIPFSSASAGQQATALLRILLAQGGMPLIIDQPEEDLDSQVIQEIVSQIWSAKQKRQVVFASHNANLVVNGDAELVIACDYRKAGDQSGGQIKLEGAIDVPAVREEITKVMEGGEKAFRLRKDKYGF